jgi:hypothetical protein
MTQTLPGQMTWRPNGANTSSVGVLYLRHHILQPWRPYTDFPEYLLPDPPGFSQGYATFLELRRKNWQSV